MLAKGSPRGPPQTLHTHGNVTLIEWKPPCSWQAGIVTVRCALDGSATSVLLDRFSVGMGIPRHETGSSWFMIGALGHQEEVMNAAQRDLVERSLKVLGWVFAVALGLVLFAGFANRGTRFIEDIFDPDEAATIVWPLLVAAAVLLWTRAFMRAGRE